ncbi:hypothetical protein N7519_008629 [Penicillium mononematosum]|uniref:uncharacterized protein n=1 Tax=Penicillium mononematosum TaxID=268346 RepID=UPI002546A0DD|nr:uncharacterized protein N7519_008629 [Penicillium mononematosum]KAJ6178168.1 hypothetical protein N7519_008629 [Penicillium mononematosum]
MPALLPAQLEYTIATIARSLDSLQIDFALMGGAAVCLTAPDPSRQTQHVDLVIHVDQTFGHIIAGYKLNLPEGDVQGCRGIPFQKLVNPTSVQS